MNSKLIIALAVAFSGQVLYHFCQKAVAPGLNPIVALVAFYAVAALASLPLLAAFPLQAASMAQELRAMNWAVIGVGVSIVLIEVGFLLAYRTGAELSSAFVLTSASVACALLLLGVLAFGETVSLQKLLGVAFAIAGIVLVSRG